MNNNELVSEMLVKMLSELNRYQGEVFVICLEGEVLTNENMLSQVAKDIVLLKDNGINPVIVHGESNQLDAQLIGLGAKLKHVSDVRINDAKTIELLEMVLSANINKRIVSAINDNGGSAIGISGKDANLIEAKRTRTVVARKDDKIDQIVDFGFYGEPTIVNPDFLMSMEENEFIPVISPIARGEDGETFQVDQYTLAGLLAMTLITNKLIFLTDFSGIVDKESKIIRELTQTQLAELLPNQYLDPELEYIGAVALDALEHFVESINIISAKSSHSLLHEIFTSDGRGTVIVQG